MLSATFVAYSAPQHRQLPSHSTVWGGGVGRRDLVDEAVDRVLVGSEHTRPVVRRRQSALHRLARGPVLPVGEVPEVDGVRRAEAGLLDGSCRKQPLALDTCPV